VELMVVMAVIALLAGMTVPRMWAGSRRARLRGACQRLMLAAQYARDYAVTRRCQTRLVINADEGTYAVAAPTGENGEYEPLADGPGRPEALGEGLGFAQVLIDPCAAPLDEVDQGGLIVRFQPSGQADAAVVQVRDEQETYSVTVQPATARVRVVAAEVTDMPLGRVDLDA
jgi:Tfp pilus assembly protein FimT